MSVAVLSTPVGPLVIRAEDDVIVSVSFADAPVQESSPDEQPVILRQCVERLRDYMAGAEEGWEDFPVYLSGTPFRQRVWCAAMRIPAGTTVTYGEIAAAIGCPGAARAVGSALAENVLGIIVPCHRVLPASGGMGGFAWGVQRKEWLLNLEARR